MVFDYDSRIYERMNYNADFLQVSLGTGDIDTKLKLQTSFKEQSKDKQAIFAKRQLKSIENNIKFRLPCHLAKRLLVLLEHTIQLILRFQTFWFS